MNPTHQMFAVGRILKKDCRVIILARVAPPLIRGPWELRAIVAK
jgi:hypothetical protein